MVEGRQILVSIDDYWYRYREDNIVEDDPYIKGSWDTAYLGDGKLVII